eukprot:5096525-Amphidinium_carterae.1
MDDMPLKAIDPMVAKKHSYTCVLEVLDLPDKPDMDKILQRLSSSSTTGETPWVYNEQLPTHQYIWVCYHHTDGHWQLLRLMHSPKDCWVGVLSRACRGEILILDSNPNKMPSAMQFMLMNLDGVTEPKGSRTLTKAETNAAIDYINQHRKTGVGNNESMRWAWREHHDPASPLFH